MYTPNGVLTSVSECVDGKQVAYEWDGETMKAMPDTPTFGAGQWQVNKRIIAFGSFSSSFRF